MVHTIEFFQNFDFGKEWVEIPCSDIYWNEGKSIFDIFQEDKINQNQIILMEKKRKYMFCF